MGRGGGILCEESGNAPTFGTFQCLGGAILKKAFPVKYPH